MRFGSVGVGCMGKHWHGVVDWAKMCMRTVHTYPHLTCVVKLKTVTPNVPSTLVHTYRPTPCVPILLSWSGEALDNSNKRKP